MEHAGNSMMECKHAPGQNGGTDNHVVADKSGNYCEDCDHGMVAPNTAARHD